MNKLVQVPFMGTYDDFLVPKGLKKLYCNNEYAVQEYVYQSEEGEITHLMISRHDRHPVHSWTDLQEIKNSLAGPDRVAVEVYPAQKTLVDRQNTYHLWVYPEGYKLPFDLNNWCDEQKAANHSIAGGQEYVKQLAARGF